MNRSILFLLLCVLIGVPGFSQLPDLFGTPPKSHPDTLYFPINDGVQLVVVNGYDTWQRKVSFHNTMQPRAMSWGHDNPLTTPNIYVFRNDQGEILKSYSSMSKYWKAYWYGYKTTDLHGGPDTNHSWLFKPPGFVNATEEDLSVIQDYRTFNKHLKFLGDSNRVGIIDLRGDIVVPAVYDNIRRYGDGDHLPEKYVIERNNRFGMMDSDFQILFEPIYRTKIARQGRGIGYPEHNQIDNHIVAFKGDKAGLIDENGEVLIPFRYDHIMHAPGNDSMILAYTFIEELEGNRNFWNNMQSCTVYDKNFSVLSEIKEYDQVIHFGVNLFLVSKNGKSGLLDRLGKVFLPLEYDEIVTKKGVYLLRKNRKWGVVSYEGEVLLPHQFDGFEFYGSTAFFTKDGLIGVYKSTGFQVVAEPQFVRKHWDMGKYILTDESGRQAYVQYGSDRNIYVSQDGDEVLLWERKVD